MIYVRRRRYFLVSLVEVVIFTSFLACAVFLLACAVFGFVEALYG